ncbi:MAG: GGDEF domain-containing protein [Actinobacteria bacterium]|nr:MAG: GGDEF domain-containing protein [Actinomycetota bacterium]
MSERMLAPTAPAPGLPDQAKIFLFAVGIAATAISMPALLHGGRPHGWIAFAVLAVAAAVAQLFAFHTIRNQVFHTTPLFFIAGVMLLPPQLLILLPLISHVPDWLRKRYAWYIQTFNILNFTLAIMAAWGADRLVSSTLGDRSGSWAAGAAAAVIVYVVLNNGSFAVILHLARGHSPRDILNPQTLSADAALACLGIAFAHFWQVDAWLLPFAIAPLALLHAALHLPQLREEARMDSKTGLANARHFMETLKEELTRARRFSRPLSVIVADLDLLRNVNNTYGHLAGDAVLAGIAEIVRSHVRRYDVAARFGGEEFAIVLPETTEMEAWETAERIRQAVAETPIWAENAGQYVNVTLSMGVASFPAHGTDPDDLLHHADVAAYHAKLQGRNRAFRASRRARLSAVAGEPLIAAVVREMEETPPRRRREVARFGRPARAGVLVTAVGAAGIAAGGVAALLAHRPEPRALLVVAALVAVGQFFALEIDNGTISAGAVAALAGVAMFGAGSALLLAAIGVVMDVAARR